MPLDLTAVGAESDWFEHRYDWRDLALYALSVGATVEQDLDLIYEGRGPLPLPSYPVVFALPAVKDLERRIGGGSEGVLHVGQRVRLARALPIRGTLRTRGRVTGIHDLRKLAQSTVQTWTQDERSDVVAETEWVIFHTRDLAPGAEPPPPRASVRPPARPCDVRLQQPVAADQAALYRLNGDDNPLHVDPAFAAAAGYKAPILHGLCTFGMACVGLRRAGVDLRALRRLEGQFRAPVFPGDVLTLEIWRDGHQMFLRAHAEGRPGEPALAHGYAELASGASADAVATTSASSTAALAER